MVSWPLIGLRVLTKYLEVFKHYLLLHLLLRVNKVFLELREEARNSKTTLKRWIKYVLPRQLVARGQPSGLPVWSL